MCYCEVVPQLTTIFTMSLDAYDSALSASTITAATAVAGLSLPNLNSLNVAVQLRENVWKLLEGDEPENTRKAMEPKMKEFMYYCHCSFPTDPHYSILTKEKIYNFMFYVAFREAKPKGGRRPAQSEAPPFDFEDYQSVLGLPTGFLASHLFRIFHNPVTPSRNQRLTSIRPCYGRCTESKK